MKTGKITAENSKIGYSQKKEMSDKAEGHRQKLQKNNENCGNYEHCVKQ